MAMLPQSSVGEMDREIQTRPPAERQSQLPNYLLSRVCTTINANSSPHSAAYVRRWIGSALLQIMVYTYSAPSHYLNKRFAILKNCHLDS